MSVQTINISLPKKLVQQVDAAAKADFASRSSYIRQALVAKLRIDTLPTDDWTTLLQLSDELGVSATERGYTTKADFVRAVKEVRAKK